MPRPQVRTLQLPLKVGCPLHKCPPGGLRLRRRARDRPLLQRRSVRPRRQASRRSSPDTSSQWFPVHAAATAGGTLFAINTRSDPALGSAQSLAEAGACRRDIAPPPPESRLHRFSPHPYSKTAAFFCGLSSVPDPPLRGGSAPVFPPPEDAARPPAPFALRRTLLWM